MSKKPTPKPAGERYLDRQVTCGMCLKEDIAYMRVANMSAKGDGREKTDWWQVTALCKTCRPKFEKNEHFVDWMELPK